MAALGERRLEQARQRAQVVGAEHDVEVGQLVGELLAVALADAAAYGDDALRERRARAQRDVLEGSHLAVEARVRRFAHAAGHERHDVGLFDGFNGKRAQAFQHAGDALGIVLVHLASERADAERQVREWCMHSPFQWVSGAVRWGSSPRGCATPRV